MLSICVMITVTCHNATPCARETNSPFSLVHLCICNAMRCRGAKWTTAGTGSVIPTHYLFLFAAQNKISRMNRNGGLLFVCVCVCVSPVSSNCVLHQTDPLFCSVKAGKWKTRRGFVDATRSRHCMHHRGAQRPTQIAILINFNLNRFTLNVVEFYILWAGAALPIANPHWYTHRDRVSQLNQSSETTSRCEMR